MSQVSEAASRVREAARQWGFQDDQPEGVFVRSVTDLLTAVEAKLDSTRDLPMDKIEAAMRKAAANGLADAAKSCRRSHDWWTWTLAGAIGVTVLATAAAMGFLAGQEAAGRAAALAASDIRPVFQSGLDGAEWLRTVVINNNPSQLAAACRASHYTAAGGEACRINLWTGKGAP